MTVGEILNVKDFDYMIHPHDGRFKVMWGVDGSTVFETANQTNVYPCLEYCRDQMLARGEMTVIKPFYHATDPFYPTSQALQLDAAIHKSQSWRALAGPWSQAVQIRATNNTPIIEFTSTGNALQANSFENFYFTHNQAGYTSSIIRFLNASIEVVLRGLRFGDSGRNVGNAIGFEVLSTTNSQYEIVIDTIVARGFENSFYFNIQAQNATTFISSLILSKIMSWNAKRVARAVGITDAKLLAVHFDNIHYQYSASNPPDVGGGVFDFASDLSSWLIKISDSIIWDIPANVNFVNAGIQSEIMLNNTNGIQRIGGAGATKVKSLDYYNHAQGTVELPATAGNRDYTITHNLGMIPRHIDLTVRNLDTNAILPYTIPDDATSVTSTIFKVRFNRPPPLPNRAGYNNLHFSWRVYY